MRIDNSLKINGTASGAGGGGTSFITEFTVGAGESITLPLVSGGSYSFLVDWGDGNVDEISAYDDADRIHDYTASGAGTYTVTITGTCDRWDFNAVSTSATKLTKIVNFGNVGWLVIDSAFKGCTALTTVEGGGQYLSNVTNSSSVFRDTTNLISVSTTLILSSTTDITRMFQSSGITESPILILDNPGGRVNCGNLYTLCTSMTAIPAIDFSNSENFLGFNTLSALTSITAYGIDQNFDISNASLNAAALDTLYTNLADVSGSPKTITVTDNPGTSGDDPDIATEKGWTVTGS